MADERLARLAPWSGLVAGAIAASAQQQILADLLHYACAPDMRRIGLAIGVAAALLAIGGGLVSLRARRDGPELRDLGARRFVAELGVLAAVLFLFAIALQTAAAWLVPPCAP